MRVTWKTLIEALTFGQIPQGSRPDLSYPDRSLIGVKAGPGPTPTPSAKNLSDPDIPLFSTKQRRSKRGAVRQTNDDDEVFTLVMSILDKQ